MTYKNTRPLTGSQKKTLAYIRKFHAEHGYAPNRKEIHDAIGYSYQTIVIAVQQLADKEYVFAPPYSSDIELLAKGLGTEPRKSKPKPEQPKPKAERPWNNLW